MCVQYGNVEARRKTGEDNCNKVNQHNIIIVPTISEVKQSGSLTVCISAQYELNYEYLQSRKNKPESMTVTRLNNLKVLQTIRCAWCFHKH